MYFYGPWDAFFVLLHSFVIAFNLLGWIWRTTRRANLWLLLATGASWFGLGAVYGLGYCPLTDWHYRLLALKDVEDLPISYMAYMVERLSGWRPPSGPVNWVVGGGYFAALALSLGLNWRDRHRQRQRQY